MGILIQFHMYQRNLFFSEFLPHGWNKQLAILGSNVVFAQNKLHSSNQPVYYKNKSITRYRKHPLKLNLIRTNIFLSNLGIV